MRSNRSSDILACGITSRVCSVSAAGVVHRAGQRAGACRHDRAIGGQEDPQRSSGRTKPNEEFKSWA